MPADLPCAGTADRGCSAVAASIAPPVDAEPARAEPLAAGQCWRGQFMVTAGFGEPAGRWFQARQLASGRDVHLRRSKPAVAHERARVFAKLRDVENPQLQRALESQATAAERVEVWESVSGPSLRTWRATRGPPDTAEVTALVRQVARALESLHQLGLGHFGLSPDAITVRTTTPELEFVLGGCERVEEIDNQGLIPIDPAPHYAPPETAGLFQHRPGPGLLAWDWWSLGRVVQEFLLGDHAITLLPPETRAQLAQSGEGAAGSLLYERAAGVPRAGLVEFMTGIDPRIDRLLHGLLTSSMDGRWGAPEVQAWLNGELPGEHYHVSRQTAFFRLDGRSHTVAAAAEILRGPTHWAQAEEHVTGADKPGTLAHFLAQSTAYRAEWEQLHSAAALAQSTALSRVPPPLQKSIATALALHALAQQPFRWRGQVLNAENLRVALAQPEAFPVLRAELIALGLPAVVMQIRRYDQTAANLLETLIKPVEEAEAFLAREFGRTAATFGPPARLWLLALSGEAALRATVLQLKTEHVCSTNAALESLLHATSLAPYQVLVLARAADNPRHFGLLTHEEVRRRRLAQLLEEADDLAQIIFWQRLAEAMRAGLLVFGRHRHLIGTGVGAIFLLAVHVPGLNGVALGLAPLAAAFGLRLLGNRLQATAVARWALRAKPWSWRDGIARCGAELRALGQREDAAPSSVLRRQFESLVAEIRKIARADESAHLRLPPRPFATWALGQAGWLLALLLVGASAWYGYRQPPSWSAHVAAWERVFASSTAPGTPSDLISWPYRPSLIAEPTEIRSLGAFVPTPEQQRHALARGRQLVAPYQPETINALVAVLVQTENGEGLLLFDGRKGTLVPGKGTRIGFVPERKTWLGLEGQRVLFIER